MQVGDLVWTDRWKIGIVVAVDWCTDIGTPFDYGVYYFAIDRIEGTDEWDGDLKML